MSVKSKSTKRRVSIKDTKGVKTLTKKDQKKVRGGLLPYIEQDSVKGRQPNVSSITDGTSNTLMIKK